MKQFGIVFGILIIFGVCMCCCSIDNKSDEDLYFENKNDNYVQYLYDMCGDLSACVNEGDDNGLFDLLSEEMKNTIGEQGVSDMITCFASNNIDNSSTINDSITGLNRFYRDKKLCVSGEINFYKIEGNNGKKYDIRIQQCLYVENNRDAEGISFIRVVDVTDGYDVLLEYGKQY